MSSERMILGMRSLQFTNFSSQNSSTPASLPERRKQPRHKLLIGIDFGTTFSTVSFLFTKDSKSRSSQSIQEIVRSIDTLSDGWPGSVDETPTVPTEILYADIINKPDKWIGHQIAEALEDKFSEKKVPTTATRICLSKLLLHESRETEAECVELKSWARAAKKDPLDFVRDFLKFLSDYIETYFETHHSGWVGTTIMEFIGGCPSAWSMHAHRKLAEIAAQAGMPLKFMGSEAEAALATYLAEGDDPELKVGDAVVVVDAGGGTVDLVTMVIKTLDPLEVYQACVSEGATCGGVYVDRRMKELLIKKLSYQNLPIFEEMLNDLMEKFVFRYKKRFDGHNDSHFEVRDKIITITCDEMKKVVFDPSVDELVRKVIIQITTSERTKNVRIKTIALGGGFGGNNYVRNRIVQAVTMLGNGKANIQVQKLAKPGTANVSKGLVLLASTAKFITQRRARVNYGLLTYAEYDENEHGTIETVCPKAREEFGGQLLVKLVDWFLVKGQKMNENFTIRRNGRQFGMLPESMVVEEELITYEGDELPKDLMDKKYTLYKDLPKDIRIEKLAADIEGIDKDEHFEKHLKETPGAEPEPFYTTNYDFQAKNEFYALDEMICSFTLMSKNGQHLRVPTTIVALKQDKGEGEGENLLGSLVTRIESGPHIPESDFARSPMFADRKRCGDLLEAEGSDRGMTTQGTKRVRRGHVVGGFI